MPQRSHRAAIVDSARTLLRRKGLVATSVADITTAAGVPKGSFYNHFESKEQLLAEVVRLFSDSIDLSDLSGAGTAPERLRHHFGTGNELLVDDEMQFGCLLGSAAGGAPDGAGLVQAAVRDGFARWRAAVAACVAEGQAAGEIAATRTSEEIADLLIETFEGAALMARATGDHSAPLRHVETAIDVLTLPTP
jgi:TetR/AcrR family transcriptional regulator, transcriptional repressor for nem operon